MKIVCFLFDRITALDAVGPYEVLARLPDATVTFAALERGPVRTADGMLGLVANTSLAEVDSCDLLLVPGGPGTRALAQDPRVLEWIRAMDARSTVTASVCTGALLLAAAGLLEGRRATTHWAMLEDLRSHGATPVAERVVRDGKYATAAGVSAGIDLGLTLAAELAGEDMARTIQLSIEYDPAPPFDGSPAKAPARIVEGVLRRIRAIR